MKSKNEKFFKKIDYLRPKYNEEKRLCFIASQLMSTFFLFPFIPQNAIFSAIILILFYFLDKVRE